MCGVWACPPPCLCCFLAGSIDFMSHSTPPPPPPSSSSLVPTKFLTSPASPSTSWQRLTWTDISAWCMGISAFMSVLLLGTDHFFTGPTHPPPPPPPPPPAGPCPRQNLNSLSPSPTFQQLAWLGMFMWCMDMPTPCRRCFPTTGSRSLSPYLFIPHFDTSVLKSSWQASGVEKEWSIPVQRQIGLCRCIILTASLPGTMRFKEDAHRIGGILAIANK